ncbi:MAG: zinc transport system permease protein [Actinomycetota bacterium]|nr:zinc transport system permease protein [Actinomycetota bacterium]
MEMLQYDFMQRALLASLLVGLTAPVVGIYLVQRRLALIGDGMGHVALSGVAVGVFTGTAPVLTALVSAIACAVAIELVRAKGKASADVVLAVMFYGGIAGGVVLIGIAPEGTPANLNSYLFGAITTTTQEDLIAFAGLGIAVLGIAVGLGRQLFAASNDEEYARASGLNVLGMNILLAVLTATTVVISMRVVGLLLISALMILPNAVSQQVADSFRTSLITAITVGVTVSVAGTACSYYTATPSGGTIVLLAVAVFVLAALASWFRRMVHVLRHRPAAEHPHEHGPGCGHPAVPHGDHVDYLHDGHRHALHGDHYDTH